MLGMQENASAIANRQTAKLSSGIGGSPSHLDDPTQSWRPVSGSREIDATLLLKILARDSMHFSTISYLLSTVGPLCRLYNFLLSFLV
jgi:hypothetical protein